MKRNALPLVATTLIVGLVANLLLGFEFWHAFGGAFIGASLGLIVNRVVE